MKLTVLFVLAALQLVSAHQGPKFRKSLSFGPTLGHARFEQVAASSGYAPSDKDRHPHTVAREFMADHHPRTDGNGWAIRTDSYTDKRTGVSHVYLVQHIHDVPVADGVVHLNIKDGRVISFGDSFYTGNVPDHVSATTFSRDALVNTQRAYCADLEDHVTQPVYDQQRGAQVPLASEHSHGGLHASIADVHKHNCAQSDRAAFTSLSGDQLASPAAAVLSFMMQATPDAGLAEDIAADMLSHMNKIEATITHHANGHPFMTLANVPGAVKPVKAHQAFVQTPSSDGKSSELNLVWKFEVEMQDNWYDAAVSVADPSIIFSVVDWVSDSPYYPQPAAGTALPTSRLGRPQPPPAGRVKTTTDHKLSEGGPHKYHVFPWGLNDPTEGKREKLEPQPDALASPHGWHSIAAANDPAVTSRLAPTPPRQTLVNYTTTFGNNVFAQENWEGRGAWLDNYRPKSTSKWPNLTFDYKYDPKAEDDGLAEAQQWIDNTITQLFYTINQVHDLYYRYGFDEVSGNFQQSNWGRGGAENDGIIANAQDGSGYNNANFATPPDGQNGRCRMYLWNTATPYRDGDLEAGIVIHEVSHGLSTRLTGGPADSSCLAWGESGGMGEGWGDFIATMIRANETYQDFPMGAWAANQKGGIRNYPYSLDYTVNPSTYATLDKYWGVHAIGEVWAEILWTVAQKFIKKHGFSETLFPPAADSVTGEVSESNDFYRPRPRNSLGEFVGPYVPKHGNTLIVQLVFDGMKIQPCRPGFFDARDAIIQADEILTGGENLCELWEGFAERGLGPAATVIGKTPWGGGVRKDDFAVPSACRKEPKEPKKSSWF